MDSASLLERAGLSQDRPCEYLDVRTLGPPEPLMKTLEELSQLPNDVVLVQKNDRVPQLLFPKLEDRGYQYETIERDDEVLTLVWK